MSAPYSMRRRLLIVLGLAISLATLLQAGIAYRVALREVDDIADSHMVQMAFAVRRSMPEPATPAREHSPLEGEDHSFSLRVISLPPQAPHGFSTRSVGDRQFRVFALPTRTRLIEVMQDKAIRSSNAGKLALRTVLPVLILGPVLLLIVWWGISRALHPLTVSRREIARRDANDLTPLQTEEVPEELLPFIVEINVLFARISKAFAAQQNFVADAAHELRSPLAALRLQVQGLQRAVSDETRAIAAERVMTGIDRATRLVEQMLALAHEEATQADKTPCNLPQVLRLALSDVLPLIQAREIDIGANFGDAGPEENISVHANAEALRVLLRNLLDNAAKYAPLKGTIKLALRIHDRQISLRIEDNGPGIPAAERTHVFERFRRGHDHDVSGSGLGLSIVRAIADRHGVNIELGRSTELGGLSVTLHFAAVS